MPASTRGPSGTGVASIIKGVFNRYAVGPVEFGERAGPSGPKNDAAS